MGRLAKFRQRMSDAMEEPEPLLSDPWEYLDELKPVAEAVKDGDWPALRAILDEYPDPDDAAFMGYRLVDVDGIEDLLTDALEHDPEDTNARALLGGRIITLGWEIRGRGWASTVSEEQADAFHDHVRRGDALLTEVIAHDPGNVHAAGWRNAAARALGMGQNETRRRYTQFAAHRPHCWQVQSQVLQGVLPKWGGEWKDALQFAVDAVRTAPPGAHCAALIPDFHVEKWIDNDKSGRDYWKQHSVRVELAAAADRSVLHPDHRRGLSWVATHNMFAMALSLAEDWERAHVLFEGLENRFHETAWRYLAHPETSFHTFRRDAARAMQQQ